MTSPPTPSSPAGIETAAPKPTLHRLLMAALLIVIAGGLLAPIWTVPYPAIMDYPNHLASAFVLAHLKDPAFHFADFYSSDWNTYPYLTMDAILLGLQRFVPIDVAGRLLLSLCVLSVPAAAWFFIHQANPGEEKLAFWSLLVANNLYFLLFGFLNLQLSLAICLGLLGMWLWHLKRPRPGTWCLLLVVATALYFTHLAGFAVAAVVMTVYAWSVRRPIKDLASAWALYIPGALFYLHSLPGHAARSAWQFRSLPDKIGSLVALVVGCSTTVDVLTLLVLLGTLAWAQIDNPEFQWNRPWRRVTWVLFGLYWILPAAYGPATNIDKRLLPIIFVFSLAGAKVGRRSWKLSLVAILLFCLRAGTLERHFVILRPHLANLAASFSAIPPGARVLPLVDWAGGAPLPERHFWAYGVIARGWVSPCLFHDPGVHPLALRVQLYAPCVQAFTSTTQLDWESIQGQYDYVWAYRVPLFSPALSRMGGVVFADDDLKVFRMGLNTR